MHIVSGATQLTLGVANGVSLFSEMCMFLVVFRILERTGCFLFMGLGLLGYTVRFIAFATIENPWIVLPFEVLQGVPSEYLGTLQGFLHGVYWGLGAGTGHMIAGLSVENLGARVTFWMFAAGSFVNAVAFLIIQR
ncbi:MFSD6-like protein, partial [Mya arenaria]